MQFKIIYVLFAISLYSCNSNNDNADKKWEQEKNTRNLDVTNDAYKNALVNTQTTIDTFLNCLANRQKHDWQYFIKKSFAQGDKIEHLWIEVDSAGNSTIFGRIGNEPIKLTNIKYGERVAIPLKEVEDYVIYEKDSVILGNFINRGLEK